MSACSQCGTVVKAEDRFCNVCGASLVRPHAQPPAPEGAGTPFERQPQVVPQGASGASHAARCQLGHEIPPGATYCPQGHPISLDQMQFANDPYAGAYAPVPVPVPVPGFFPPPRPVGAYQAPGGHSPAPQQVYTPPPLQAAYAAAYAAPVQPGFAPQPAGGYAPPAAYPGTPSQGPLPFGDAPRDAAPPKALRGFLVAYGMNPSGDFWPLTGGRHTIGRFGSSDGLEIPLQDPTISSRHAVIIVEPSSGSIVVEDTGSTNGTFVNDEHIGPAGRRELRDGDRLRLGGFTTIVKVIGRV